MCWSNQISVRFSCLTSSTLCQYLYVLVLHKLENRFMDSSCVLLKTSENIAL